MSHKFNVLIIGGGSWGKSIASTATQSNFVSQTTIYSRNELPTEQKQSLMQNLSPQNATKLHFTTSLNDPKNIDIVFIAIPLKAFEDFFTQNAKILKQISKNFVICSKGYIKSTLQSGHEYLQSQIFDSNYNIAMLSGPNFSSEVMLCSPTITTIASKNDTLNKTISQCLTTNCFQCQITNDITGVSLLGLCKNAIAIGFGLICGSEERISKSTNAKSMFLSLIIKQTAELIVKIGGQESTINLSAGIGDIFLSCSDLKSRNVLFGTEFGAEFYKQNYIKNKQDTINTLTTNKTVEGIDSIYIIHQLAKMHGIKLPLYEQLYEAVFNQNIAYTDFINNVFNNYV